MKRGGGRRVREEDRHHRQVLVTVELGSFSERIATKCSYSYTLVSKIDKSIVESIVIDWFRNVTSKEKSR